MVHNYYISVKTLLAVVVNYFDSFFLRQTKQCNV